MRVIALGIVAALCCQIILIAVMKRYQSVTQRTFAFADDGSLPSHHGGFFCLQSESVGSSFPESVLPLGAT